MFIPDYIFFFTYSPMLSSLRIFYKLQYFISALLNTVTLYKSTFTISYEILNKVQASNFLPLKSLVFGCLEVLGSNPQASQPPYGKGGGLTSVGGEGKMVGQKHLRMKKKALVFEENKLFENGMLFYVFPSRLILSAVIFMV